MTAISWLCRRKLGFALAADGMGGFVAETPEEEKRLPPPHTQEQKIFVTKFKGRDIAYAFMGKVFNEHRTFNLLRDAEATFDLIAKNNPQNIYDYIYQFAGQMKAAFDTAKADGRLKEYVKNPHCPVESEANVIARIFFAGYFRKREPSFAIVTLRHENQVIGEPEIRIETPPENDYLAGAGGIAASVYGKDDHWVKTYAHDVPPNGSLDDIAALAEGFVRACCDPRAVEVDPSCKGIGGHVHVAELTPSGFTWRIPPIEQKTAA